METCAIFVIVTCCVVASTSAWAECKTPGNCVNIRQCPYIYQLLAKKPISYANALYVRNSHCGFDGRIPKVCCPPEAPISQAPPDGDISNHTNRQLLPDYPDCGLSVHFERIVGGVDATVGEFPWTVLLGYSNSNGTRLWGCGGSLISDRYVLTAAHCIKPPGVTLTHVRLGEHTISSENDCEEYYCSEPAQDIEVNSTSIHDQYSPQKFNNDIALIRLERRVTFSNFIQPICLPFNELSTNNLENLKPPSHITIVAGWGRTVSNNPTISDVLQKLKVPIVPLLSCANAYGTEVQLGPEQLCAGGDRGKDSCKGDSGGALMFLKADGGQLCFYAVGVVSAGPKNCGEDEGKAGIYTRVGAYLPWILDNIDP